MKKYDIAVIISEPGLNLEDMEATNTVSMTLREVSREKLLEVKLPLAGLVEQFEEMFEEN